MLSDIEIAQAARLRPVAEVARELGANESEIELYGQSKAKLNEKIFERTRGNEDGKLVLVTAVNPTPAGEGKTTVTIGLGDALRKLGKKVVVALREPSLGPVLGMKGGATGGGYSQVVPMEDINLHFTGDMHAITSANNLLCAMLDNHLHQGNELSIDPRMVEIRRCLDINDRALRHVVVGLGGKTSSIPREDEFIITVASEVMAILCLAQNFVDLKARLGNILVAYTASGQPVFAKDLKVEGAMAALLKQAFLPNLVQTLEGTPGLIHGGPFANIAHGCSSVRGTRLALKLADFCVTEAGFGSDLGAEKFFNIKCQIANLRPWAVVLVATARSAKYNAGVPVSFLGEENLEALSKGADNLAQHIENLQNFGVPVVVAINKFPTDTAAELKFLQSFCAKKGVRCAVFEGYVLGGLGGEGLAKLVCEAAETRSQCRFTYDLGQSIREKICAVAKKIYRAGDVVFSKKADDATRKIEHLAKNFPVCIAKTPYSFSDNPSLLGRPRNFKITISDVKISHGAGFVVALAGDVLTMPGLPKKPLAESIGVGDDGEIFGLM